MSKYVGNGAELNRARTAYKFKQVHETTLRVGYWVPIYVDSYVSPFTTYNLDLESFLRALPLTRPPMGELELYCLAAFVPHRIVWEEFKEFMGENNTTAWTGSYSKKRPSVTYNFGTGTLVSVPSGSIWTFLENSTRGTYADWHHMTLGAYLGYPDMFWTLGGSNRVLSAQVDSLATRSYLAVWNEFVRDQPTQSPIAYSKQTVYGTSDSQSYYAVNNPVLPINKVKDVFTGVLPEPQMGTAMNIPLAGTLAPVVTKTTAAMTGSQAAIKWNGVNSGSASTGVMASDATSGHVGEGAVGSESLTWHISGQDYTATPTFNKTANVYPANLWADLGSVGSTPLADFRNAVLTNQWMERRAHYGNKYYESCIAEFGGRPDNVREDLPEALGRIVLPLNIQAVTSTAGTSDQALGAQAAKSETYGRSNLFTYTTQEHGTLVICVGIRQSHHVYCQRMDRQFIDYELFEQTWPSFAGSTDVPVPCNFMGIGPYDTSGANLASNWGFTQTGGQTWRFDARSYTDQMPTLGYQQYGFQEKFPVSYASGLLNPGVEGALTDFTMADLYIAKQTLNPGFMIEQPSFVNRAFVDADAYAPNFVAKFELTGTVVRVLPGRVVAGVDRI